MSNRKVNIQIEVDDQLYDGVIRPAKDNRRLSSLIRRLLEGYAYDNYVGRYADSYYEEVEEFVDSDLQALLSEATSKINSVRSANDQLKFLAEDGIDAFNDESLGVRPEPEVAEPAPAPVQDDRIDRIEDSIANLTSMMESFMKVVSQTSVPAPAPAPVVTREVVRHETATPTPLSISEESLNLFGEDEDFNEDSVETVSEASSDETDDDSSQLLESLMGSIPGWG